MNENKNEIHLIHLGFGSHLNVQTSQLVSINETLILINGAKDPIELNVKIEADFNTVPPEYHEVFLNMLTSKYSNKASFGDNPFSVCQPKPKRKWYQFWKAKY
jgi:hypothetical protein